MSPISHLVDGCAACSRVQNAVELSRDKRLRQRAGLCGGQCFGNTSIDHKPLWPKCKPGDESRDRKSTRLNSSHGYNSYAVFCLKKKETRPPRPYDDSLHLSARRGASADAHLYHTVLHVLPPRVVLDSCHPPAAQISSACIFVPS